MEKLYILASTVINKLELNCKYYSGNKEFLICVICGMIICDKNISKDDVIKNYIKRINKIFLPKN